MALVRAFWNELLAPAPVVDAVGVPAAAAELVAPVGLAALVGVVELVVAIVPVTPAAAPVVPAVPALEADKLVVCVPLAAPAAVLT